MNLTSLPAPEDRPIATETSTQRPILLAGAGLSAFVAVWLGLGGVQHNVDDAFISLRYAWNLANGEGLSFNPGEFVEGYSNPLWTLLLTLPLRLGWDGLLATKVLGLGFTAIAAFFTVMVAGELARPQGRGAALATILGAGMLAVSHPAAWWATGGLETPSVGALLIAALYLMLREDAAPGRVPWSALVAGLAGVSRPETPLLVAGLALGRALLAWPRRDLRGLLLWCALAAAPTLAWMAFRLNTYPDPLPNTYYRKVGDSDLSQPIAYTMPWLKLEFLFASLGALGLGLATRARPAAGLAMAGIIGGQIVFLGVSRGDWMPSWRFVAPLLPALAAAAGAGLGILAGRWRLVPAVAALALLAQAWRSVPVAEVHAPRRPGVEAKVFPREAADYAPASLSVPLQGAMEAGTVWLLEHIPAEHSLAYTEIGLPGFAGGWRILDLAGLVTRETSGASGMGLAEQARFIREWKPDWIVLKAAKVPLLEKVREAKWLERYVAMEGPYPGMMAYRRANLDEATPRQALDNLARAAERAPRLRLLLKRWARLARREGTPADMELVCAHVARHAPDDEKLVKLCARKGPREAPDRDVEPDIDELTGFRSGAEDPDAEDR